MALTDVVMLHPEAAWVQRTESLQWDAELFPVGREATTSQVRAGGGDGRESELGLCVQCQ